EIVRATKKLTSKPFGVNLVLQWSPLQNLKVCLEEGVKIVSFFWGDPSPYIKMVHDADGLVMSTVASASEARKVSDAGVDVVVAQGWEAGGARLGEGGVTSPRPLCGRCSDAKTRRFGRRHRRRTGDCCGANAGCLGSVDGNK